MEDNLKWIEIFKAGTHTSSNGLTRDYTPEELDEVVETYNPSHFKAPLIVSSPAHNTAGFSDKELWRSQLAFGFPDKVKRIGKALYAGFSKISPQVREWINGGAILGFSSSFYLPHSPVNPYPGKLSLRHIAGCGVEPPAVKGMATPELSEYLLADIVGYSEDDEGAVEFSLEGLDESTIEDARLGARLYKAIRNIDSAVSSFGCCGEMGAPNGVSQLARILKMMIQGQRDRMIDDKSLELAEQVYPSYLLDELTNLANAPTPQYATMEDVFKIVEGMKGEEEYDDYSEKGMNYLKKKMADEEMDMAEVSKKTGIGTKKLQSFMDDEEDPTDDEAAMLAECFNCGADKFKKKKGMTNMSETPEFQELQTRLAALEAENMALKVEREKDRITSFVDRMIADRKILPADRDEEITTIQTMNHSEVVAFGEVKATPRDRYMARIEARKPLWDNTRLPIGPGDAPDAANYSEYAEAIAQGADPETVKRHAKIIAQCKANGKDWAEPSNYAEAMDQLGITY